MRAAVGAEAERVEDAVGQAGRSGRGVIELDVLDLDVDRAERNGAGGGAVERRDDLDVVERAGRGMAGRRVGRQPVGAGEGRARRRSSSAALQRLDFDVDLCLVGSAGAVGGDELDLDLVDRCRSPWSCRYRRCRPWKRRGRASPARSRAPGSPNASWWRSTSKRRCRKRGDAVARRDAGLRGFEVLVGGAQALQSGQCRGVGHDTGHGYSYLLHELFFLHTGSTGMTVRHHANDH